MRVSRVPNQLVRLGSPNADSVHVLLHPSANLTAPHLDEQIGLNAYAQDVLTVPASLVGLPALSVPIAVGAEGDGWPLGVSVVGNGDVRRWRWLLGWRLRMLNEKQVRGVAWVGRRLCDRQNHRAYIPQTRVYSTNVGCISGKGRERRDIRR
jgi:hypothetical protein